MSGSLGSEYPQWPLEFERKRSAQSPLSKHEIDQEIDLACKFATPRELTGAGLGLRRAFLEELANKPQPEIDFLEVAPENWINVGGNLGDKLRRATANTPLVCHGLCLNLGGESDLNLKFIRELEQFLNEHNVVWYGDHLSYCADQGYLYDLLPIPFTQAAVAHVSDRIRAVQDLLGRQITVENISYYATPGKKMPEIDFINEILERADCKLLFDVNNIYVNSVNHSYDALSFLRNLPSDRIAYGHVAGHNVRAPDQLVDTHGEDVTNSVWVLLAKAYEYHGAFPTLLERDNDIPELTALLAQTQAIADIQERIQASSNLTPGD